MYKNVPRTHITVTAVAKLKLHSRNFSGLGAIISVTTDSALVELAQLAGELWRDCR